MEDSKPKEWIPFQHPDYEMSAYRRNGQHIEIFLIDYVGSAPVSTHNTPRDPIMPQPDFDFPHDYDVDEGVWEEAILELSPVLNGNATYYWYIRGRFKVRGW